MWGEVSAAANLCSTGGVKTLSPSLSPEPNLEPFLLRGRSSSTHVPSENSLGLPRNVRFGLGRRISDGDRLMSLEALCSRLLLFEECFALFFFFFKVDGLCFVFFSDFLCFFSLCFFSLSLTTGSSTGTSCLLCLGDKSVLRFLCFSFLSFFRNPSSFGAGDPWREDFSDLYL